MLVASWNFGFFACHWAYRRPTKGHPSNPLAGSLAMFKNNVQLLWQVCLGKVFSYTLAPESRWGKKYPWKANGRRKTGLWSQEPRNSFPYHQIWTDCPCSLIGSSNETTVVIGLRKACRFPGASTARKWSVQYSCDQRLIFPYRCFPPRSQGFAWYPSSRRKR